MTSDRLKFRFDIQNHEFNSCDYDPTLIIIQKPALNFKVIIKITSSFKKYS